MRLRFDFDRNDQNFHGESSRPIYGPTFTNVKIAVHPPSTGYRFIFYFPSGKWWNFDVVFDRRPR